MKSVMIFGTFDGAHEGHRDMFRQARRYGDFLIAVVARESTVLAVKKRKPKYSECVRYALLHGEKNIDRVVLGNQEDVYAVIREYHPDVICLGYDQEFFVQGLREVFSGEIFRLAPFHPEVHKSSKIKKEDDPVPRAKEVLRRYLLKKRKSIPIEERRYRSEMLMDAVFALLEVRNAKTIALYRSIGSEVDTQKLFSLLEKQNKVILVPGEVQNGEMTFFRVDAETHYKKGILGFPVPLGGVPYTGKIDVCIVPCVGFDAEGNRLGRGRGCYDRFLEKNPDTVSIGVVFSEQELECLPIEKHDKEIPILFIAKERLPVVVRYDILGKV